MQSGHKKVIRRAPSVARWMHLLHLETEIETRIREGGCSPKMLSRYLDSVDEVFTEYGDPIKNFPSYSLLRFCRKLQEALEDYDRTTKK